MGLKDITVEELLNAPSIIQFIYLKAYLKQGVGSSMLDEAMKSHPEYFVKKLE
jgi:hypothetical protein